MEVFHNCFVHLCHYVHSINLSESMVIHGYLNQQIKSLIPFPPSTSTNSLIIINRGISCHIFSSNGHGTYQLRTLYSSTHRQISITLSCTGAKVSLFFIDTLSLFSHLHQHHKDSKNRITKTAHYKSLLHTCNRLTQPDQVYMPLTISVALSIPTSPKYCVDSSGVSIAQNIHIYTTNS